MGVTAPTPPKNGPPPRATPSRAPSRPRATPVPSSPAASDVSAASSLAVLVLWLPRTSPMPRPPRATRIATQPAQPSDGMTTDTPTDPFVGRLASLLDQRLNPNLLCLDALEQNHSSTVGQPRSHPGPPRFPQPQLTTTPVTHPPQTPPCRRPLPQNDPSTSFTQW
ncbi:hypothetical protein BJV78DRAFT_1205034 [Lactifluus subvellereus]|nr:hypothetical protein BJV78DRAFT_1205034 [Lactifluus subvellereus]